MEENSSDKISPTAPSAAFKTDVDFCKNPHCANFGVPANFIKYRRRIGVGNRLKLDHFFHLKLTHPVCA